MWFLREFESEHYCRAQTLAEVVPASSSPSVENVGRFVYLQSDQISFTPPTGDESFNMEAPPGSVMFVREVEYCRKGHGHKTVKREWCKQTKSSFRQLSPYPTLTNIPSNFTVGEYSVDDEAMLGNRVKLQDWIPDEKSLLAFESSQASSFFRYLDDGYFYHDFPGALYQNRLGRYVYNCVPGDVRARFQVLKPTGVVSLIAMQKNERGDLGLFRSLCGDEMAFIQSGQLSIEELFDDGWSMRPWVYRIPFLLFTGFFFWVSFTWQKMPVPAPKIGLMIILCCLYCVVIFCCLRLSSPVSIGISVSISAFVWFVLYEEMRRQQALKDSQTPVHSQLNRKAKRKEA